MVFQAAAGAQVFSAETASLLIGAVALSMLISPLLLVLLDRACCAAASSNRRAARARDLGTQEAPVIIVPASAATGRSWRACDADQGHPHHRAGPQRGHSRNRPAFGYRVFYGDARLDLLRIAGAEHARVLVVAVDDPSNPSRSSPWRASTSRNCRLVARAGSWRCATWG